MGKILEALANDLLSTEPFVPQSDTEYKQVRKQVCDFEEKLIAKLNPEEKKLLDDLLDAFVRESSLYATNRFIIGFRLGMMITIEVMSESENN